MTVRWGRPSSSPPPSTSPALWPPVKVSIIQVGTSLLESDGAGGDDLGGGGEGATGSAGVGRARRSVSLTFEARTA